MMASEGLMTSAVAACCLGSTACRVGIIRGAVVGGRSEQGLCIYVSMQLSELRDDRVPGCQTNAATASPGGPTWRAIAGLWMLPSCSFMVVVSKISTAPSVADVACAWHEPSVQVHGSNVEPGHVHPLWPSQRTKQCGINTMLAGLLIAWPVPACQTSACPMVRHVRPPQSVLSCHAEMVARLFAETAQPPCSQK